MQLTPLTSLVVLILIASCGNFESNRPGNQINRPMLNLDSLLASKDTTKILITIDNAIHASLTSDSDVNRLTEPQKHFYYIEEFEREVNNGGFNQYFYNSSGDYAHETVSALSAIGANNMAKILQSAINEFPNLQVPKERIARQEVLNRIENKAQKAWDKLDSGFYTYPDDLDALNITYIKKHRKDFER